MSVLFFAQLRDFARCGAIELEVTEALTAEQLWRSLEERFPGIGRFHGSTRLARNGAFAAPGESFQPDDEVALIPPVSGG